MEDGVIANREREFSCKKVIQSSMRNDGIINQGSYKLGREWMHMRSTTLLNESNF